MELHASVYDPICVFNGSNTSIYLVGRAWRRPLWLRRPSNSAAPRTAAPERGCAALELGCTACRSLHALELAGPTPAGSSDELAGTGTFSKKLKRTDCFFKKLKGIWLLLKKYRDLVVFYFLKGPTCGIHMSYGHPNGQS